MQKPNPLGRYPLVLRDNTEQNPFPGELLFDDRDNQIYYVNKETMAKTSISKLIYDKIISAKLENTEIHVQQENESINRPFNSWTLNIYRTENK